MTCARRFTPTSANQESKSFTLWLNGYEVDFFWPKLKLVIETDGLRYHRTPSSQARDLRRDQAHTAAGYTRLRFSHWQVKYEPAYVREILRLTASRLQPG